MVSVVRPAKKQAILMTFSNEGFHTETFRVLTPNMPIDCDVVGYLALASKRADEELANHEFPSPMLTWTLKRDSSRSWGRYEAAYQHLMSLGRQLTIY